MQTLADLLPRHGHPSAPLLTHYDLTTGERVELSAITTANWVAKTANLCVDDYDAEPGTRVRIGLPTHWQRFVWILATWSFGGSVSTQDARIGISGSELVGSEPVRLAASLRPLGGPFQTPPAGFVDLATVVAGQPDIFVPLDPPTPDLPATDLGAGPISHADLLSRVSPSTERVLLTPGSIDRDVEALVAALAGSGSLVTVAGATSDGDLEPVARQERAIHLPST